MQNDEIANAFVFVDQFGVVRIDVGLIEALVGKVLEQMVNSARDQVNAGRFQGFQETQCKSQRDAIAIPKEFASAGDEAQKTRIGERLLAQSGQQIRERLVIAAIR